jgi:hypothetical protein
MSPKTPFTVAAAVAVAVLNVAFVAPVHAQVKAALVRDVDRSTSQPVNGRCIAGTDSNGAIKCVLYSVPAGKRLVVETVSYQAVSEAGTPVYQVLFGLNDPSSSNLFYPGSNIYSVTPTFVYETSARVYSATQALRIYIDENQSLAAGDTHGGTANFQQGFSFSGYLVDK